MAGMDKPIRILAIAGSLREASFNRQLLKAACLMLDRPGVEIDVVDLRDFQFPPFNEDEEKITGMPPQVLAFKDRIRLADGLVLASPEFNGSVPGAFKNTIDWASRKDNPFQGKVAAVMATSPGHFGARDVLKHLRDILNYLQVLVLPFAVAVPFSHQAFRPDGGLVDGKIEQFVQNQMDDVVRLAKALRSGV